VVLLKALSLFSQPFRAAQAALFLAKPLRDLSFVSWPFLSAFTEVLFQKHRAYLKRHRFVLGNICHERYLTGMIVTEFFE